MKMFLKTLMIILGLILILDAIFLVFVSNYNLGWILTAFMGIFFLVYGLFFHQINAYMSHGFLLWLRYFGYFLLVFLFGIIAFLAIYGGNDNVTGDEDAIIVLGAGLRGDRVSLTLAERLDAAYECWQQNPSAIIVTTGGQGPGETIQEGRAEADYLIAKGVPKYKIIIEDRSSSTKENFLFAKELLDDKLGEEYKVAYVTNAFHIYRAGKTAESVGLSATHYHGGLPLYMVPPVYFREFAAVVMFWLPGGGS
ncbi:MAG: YdcF family protein [Bacillota bacterium]|nr:YdcF family protein [Bacillota bacterium]